MGGERKEENLIYLPPLPILGQFADLGKSPSTISKGKKGEKKRVCMSAPPPPLWAHNNTTLL